MTALASGCAWPIAMRRKPWWKPASTPTLKPSIAHAFAPSGKIQREKVKALGLDQEPSIEKTYDADRGNVLTKEAAFRRIQKKTGLKAEEILVVGDRPAREIRAGKELGMHTVRVRHGEFKAQMPAGPEESPDYVIKTISEIRKLPFQWGTKTTT